jgi:hypothetical protein
MRRWRDPTEWEAEAGRRSEEGCSLIEWSSLLQAMRAVNSVGVPRAAAAGCAAANAARMSLLYTLARRRYDTQSSKRVAQQASIKHWQHVLNLTNLDNPLGNCSVKPWWRLIDADSDAEMRGGGAKKMQRYGREGCLEPVRSGKTREFEDDG